MSLVGLPFGMRVVRSCNPKKIRVRERLVKFTCGQASIDSMAASFCFLFSSSGCQASSARCVLNRQEWPERGGLVAVDGSDGNLEGSGL